MNHHPVFIDQHSQETLDLMAEILANSDLVISATKTPLDVGTGRESWRIEVFLAR